MKKSNEICDSIFCNLEDMIDDYVQEYDKALRDVIIKKLYQHDINDRYLGPQIMNIIRRVINEAKAIKEEIS